MKKMILMLAVVMLSSITLKAQHVVHRVVTKTRLCAVRPVTVVRPVRPLVLRPVLVARPVVVKRTRVIVY
ncbi:hypothetical protein LJ707_05175 [Mucilaginibacter sp. UR6-1]|uniref:hypothetical protein n=1 Tax=Mucilaginibacter sp. UR6-1 TaxID=1435643 RepID=UPI001E573BFC|nr:hypothetical protein [Mucilaginibacter sp. UR6-1]MCC8408311.1 hypothetical protein [Mucilaginibacter sp. UR6-1]